MGKWSDEDKEALVAALAIGGLFTLVGVAAYYENKNSNKSVEPEPQVSPNRYVECLNHGKYSKMCPECSKCIECNGGESWGVCDNCDWYRRNDD